MTNILWLASDRGGVGGYRVFAPALGLEDVGTYDSHMVTHAEVLFNEQCTTDNLDGMDVVVFQRAVGPKFLTWMEYCRDHQIKTVFELDDDLFNVPRRNKAHDFWGLKKVRALLRAELELADHVIVSTKPLAERVRSEMHWPTFKKISVCANHLHPHIWAGPHLESRFDNGDHIIIGWQGSLTHNQDFSAAASALVRIFQDFPQVRLRLFGAVPTAIVKDLTGDRLQFVKGVPFASYPATLAHLNFHIGIAPITDSHFNRSKSNIKYLEYAALKVPCVASNVYPYAHTITNGVDGFLADTPSDWYVVLAALVQRAELRQRVGEAAHAMVWRDYAPNGAWHDVFTQLTQGGSDGRYSPRVSDARARPVGQDASA